MGLKLGIRSERELHLLLVLARHPERFEKFNEEEKWIVYNSVVNLRGQIPDEQLDRYEQRMALQGETVEEQAESIVERMVAPIKNKLMGT